MSYAAWRNASMKFQVFAKRIKDKVYQVILLGAKKCQE